MSGTTEFSGQRVLVTGGTRGIGEAIARRFDAGGSARRHHGALGRGRRRAAGPLRGGRSRHRGRCRAHRRARALAPRRGRRPREQRRRLVGSGRRLRRADRGRLAERARDEPALRRPPRPRARPGHARARQRRGDPRVVDPAPPSALRLDARLRRGEGRAQQLQQGTRERGEPEGCARRERRSGLHRDVGGDRADRAPRRERRHESRRRPAAADGRARRHPARAPGPSRGGGRARRLPRVGPRRRRSPAPST